MLMDRQGVSHSGNAARTGLVAAAFFQNDKSSGLGLQFVIDQGDARRFLRDIDRSVITWDRNAEPNDLINQMRELCAKGFANLTAQERWVAFMNIYWLELRKHLVPDEHNGVIIIGHQLPDERTTGDSTDRADGCKGNGWFVIGTRGRGKSWLM